MEAINGGKIIINNSKISTEGDTLKIFIHYMKEVLMPQMQ